MEDRVHALSIKSSSSVRSSTEPAFASAIKTLGSARVGDADSKVWQPVDLPFRNTTDLTLPSPDQIRACTDVLHNGFAVRVVRFSDDIVVKYGRGAYTSEGQSLVYLERYAPDIPAPRLYQMYREDNETFLVMQRMGGEKLQTLWPSLSEIEKESISSRLGEIVATMHRVECPWPDFFGGLDGGKLRHQLFWSLRGDMDFMGPYNSEATMVASLIDNFRFLRQSNGYADYKARFYDAYLEKVIRGHRAVLTHGDLHPRNIVVEERKSTQPGVSRDFDVSLVDWECSGWYPEFWEFFSASSTFDMNYWEDDWCNHAHQIMPVMLSEVAAMRMLDKDLSL